jgi:hypothetical protein
MVGVVGSSPIAPTNILLFKSTLLGAFLFGFRSCFFFLKFNGDLFAVNQLIQ